MVGPRETTERLLCEQPDLEEALQAVFEVDAEQETWTFTDLPIDSGSFGKLVSRGIIERVDGEYRIAEPEVVQTVLEGDDLGNSEQSSAIGFTVSDVFSVKDQREIGALVGALTLVFIMRITGYQRILRDGRVVSPSNDPYFYRYWMEQLLAQSSGPTDWHVIAEMPRGAITRRPLTHASHWWLAELLGGGQSAADLVTAWLPVFGALLIALVLYEIAVILTADKRVGIATVLLLAVTPIQTVYTRMGFLEHRVHQYFWLTVMILILVWLAVDLASRREPGEPVDAIIWDRLRSPRTWFAVLTLGIAIGISVYLWGGSPLLFIPLAVYLVFRTAIDTRANVPPVLANLPLLAALAFGSVFAGVIHFQLGWRAAYVAFTPAMVFGWAVIVLPVGELWRRSGWHVGGLVGIVAVFAVIAVGSIRWLQPGELSSILLRIDDLVGRDVAAETGSLFATELGVIFGPVYYIGLAFYLALVALGWAGWIAYRRYEPGWLVLVVYAACFLILAGFQIRFAAQLSLILAVFGGLSFVYLLSALGLARAPAPFPNTIGRRSPSSVDEQRDGPSIRLPQSKTVVVSILLVFLIICGLNFFMISSFTDQTTYDDHEYGALVAIEDHADRADRSDYPDNFVLSEWGHSRMYNYFMSGESQGYGYALNNYEDFQYGSDPDGWFDEFGDNVGYVVLTTTEGNVPADSAQARLHVNLGVETDEHDALEHYQVVYVSADHSVSAFAVVPGATLEGTGEPGETVMAETTVPVAGESIESITYTQDAVVDEDGTYQMTVAYGGSYTVNGEEVEVSEQDVLDGKTVAIDDPTDENGNEQGE